MTALRVQKREKRRPGEPRYCRFIGTDGQRHGIELTDDNSYPTSTYCKEHHAIMAERSRLRHAQPPSKRHRRAAGEPRRCAFVEEGGQRHGIELTEANSYKTSAYCREHHNVMKARALQQEPGRTSNIKRVQAYKDRHREEVNEKRRLLDKAKRLAAQLGVSVEEAKRRLAPLALPAPAPAMIDRCFKVPNARRYHVANGDMIALCNTWRAAPGVELVSLAADNPELCRACAKRALEIAAKAAKR